METIEEGSLNIGLQWGSTTGLMYGQSGGKRKTVTSSNSQKIMSSVPKPHKKPLYHYFFKHFMYFTLYLSISRTYSRVYLNVGLAAFFIGVANCSHWKSSKPKAIFKFQDFYFVGVWRLAELYGKESRPATYDIHWSLILELMWLIIMCIDWYW